MDRQILQLFEHIDLIIDKNFSKLESLIESYHKNSLEEAVFNEKYQSVKYNGVIPHEIKRLIGFSFGTPTGHIHLKIDTNQARVLIKDLNDFLSGQRETP